MNTTANSETQNSPSQFPWAVFIAVMPAVMIAVKPGALAVVLQLVALCVVLFLRMRGKKEKTGLLALVLGLVALGAAVWAWVAHA
jgi:hypothetical protein